MKLFEMIGPNWVRYTPISLKMDFEEYKKKEITKWKSRAKMYGFRFPIFNSLSEFQMALDNAQVKNSEDLNAVHNMTKKFIN